MCVSFITQQLRLVGRLGSRNRFNNTSLVSVVTLTDRPKSVRDCCVIEVLGGVFVFLLCFLERSVVIGTSVIGLSQITSFFSYILIKTNRTIFLPFVHGEVTSFWCGCATEVPRTLPIHILREV